MKKKIALAVLVVLFGWVWVTSLIYQFAHPEMTQTQLLLHFPKTIFLDWEATR